MSTSDPIMVCLHCQLNRFIITMESTSLGVSVRVFLGRFKFLREKERPILNVVALFIGQGSFTEQQ